MSQRLFAAEAEFERLVDDAVAKTAGDPARSLELVCTWAKTMPEPCALAFKAMTPRIVPTPALAAIIKRTFPVAGGDQVAQIVGAALRSPELCEQFHQELGRAAFEALVERIGAACEVFKSKESNS